jgi:hypothetical protein
LVYVSRESWCYECIGNYYLESFISLSSIIYGVQLYLNCFYFSVSQVRVSAVLSNAPYLLNLDCDHYINNSKAIKEAMCFMMDPLLGKKVCYVQFPQRFDGIDRHDRYANRNVVFFDVRFGIQISEMFCCLHDHFP